jgi:hypothetical protein
MRRLLLFLPFLLPATSEVIPQQDGPAFSVSVNLIKVPFSVFDAGGSLVSDLRREDFNIYEDGASVSTGTRFPWFWFWTRVRRSKKN